VQFVRAFFLGALSALAAVLLHQSLPPLGMLTGLAITYSAIWYVGRETGKRRYKVVAAIAWGAVIIRAMWLGAGSEILIIADGVGYGIIFLGITTVIIAVLRKI
jgi:hypothetical protein